MNDNETLLRRAETLANVRRLLLAVNAVAYFGWIGAQALYFIPQNTVTKAQVTDIEFVLGPVWLVSLIGLVLTFFWRRDVRALIDDERTAKLTLRAFQAGYGALLVAIFLLSVLPLLGLHLNVLAIPPLLMSLGVAVPPLTYAALYRS